MVQTSFISPVKFRVFRQQFALPFASLRNTKAIEHAALPLVKRRPIGERGAVTGDTLREIAQFGLKLFKKNIRTKK